MGSPGTGEAGDGAAQAREDRPQRQRDRVRRLGDRRVVGRRRRRCQPGRPPRRRRRRRHPRRHGRRLRRRPERAPDRPLPARARRARRSSWRRRWAAACPRWPPTTRPRRFGTGSTEAASGSASTTRPGPAPLPADRGLLPARPLRSPRRPRGRRVDRRVRRQRGAGRGGAQGDRVPGLATVQIIYNIVRQRPADHFLAEAARRDVGVLARVPLASGLLSGTLTRDDGVRARRPSGVQPPRRILRRRRDVRRPRLRDRSRARRGAPVARPARRHAGPAGPAAGS